MSFMVDANSEGKTFWTNPSTGLKETDPQIVPYCIKVNLTGSNVGLIRSLSFSTGSVDSRPLALNYCVTDYYSSVKIAGLSVEIVCKATLTEQGISFHLIMEVLIL